MKKTQEQWVVDRLLKDNEISRNSALQNYISRLGAIINRLNKNGWKIEGEWDISEKGRDYVYYLRKSPYKKTTYYVPELNKLVTKYEEK